MNPELQAPQSTPEYRPPQTGAEVLPHSPERKEQSGESEPVPGRVEQQVSAPPIMPLPQPPVVVPLPQQPVADDASVGPSLAADDDLIEKEWVDKAKKIILETKDDPYRREQEVARLQADYLRKRYGKELGVVD